MQFDFQIPPSYEVTIGKLQLKLAHAVVYSYNESLVTDEGTLYWMDFGFSPSKNLNINLSKRIIIKITRPRLSLLVLNVWNRLSEFGRVEECVFVACRLASTAVPVGRHLCTNRPSS